MNRIDCYECTRPIGYSSEELDPNLEIMIVCKKCHKIKDLVKDESS